jgi:type I site-specific restriction endonuclease
MLQLNLPEYNFRIKKQNEKLLIFDSQRKKYVSLTPEESVRQHFIRFLIEEKDYPAALLAVEKQLNMNGMKKRCDAVLYNHLAQPIMIMEFKSPTIQLSQHVFDQIAVYNSKLNVDFFIISNGIEHYCCRVNQKTARYEYFHEIPDYKLLLSQKKTNF